MSRIVLAALGAVIAAPAVAGSLAPAPVEAPVVAPAPVIAAPVGTDWTGPYVGAQLGYGFGDVGAQDVDGIIGGVHGGYNYDFGQFVVGGEVDYNFADISGGAITVDQVGRLKLKAGFDAGRVLVYGTAGGAYANADVGAGDDNDFGWLVGAGADVLVTESIIAGVEYLYHDFDEFGDTGADTQISTVQAKVSFRF